MQPGMRTRRRPAKSVASALALFALFIALGGTSLGAPVRESASKLAHRVATALRVSRHADTTAKRALTTARQALANGATGVPGATGPGGATGATGPTGRPGAPGSALGYAAVQYCPGNCLDQAAAGWFAPDDDALGVDNQVNFSHPSDGVFCFRGLLFHTHNAVANIGPTGDAPATTRYTVEVHVGSDEFPVSTTDCPTQSGAPDQNVALYVRDSAGALTNPTSYRMMVLFN
jgi:hypothetical protein